MSKMVFDRPHHVLGCWTPGPSDWDFLYQRFSSPVSQRSLSVPKPAKQNGAQVASIVLSGTRGPIAFSGHPRGPRVLGETGCPKHTAPNSTSETRSRTRVSR